MARSQQWKVWEREVAKDLGGERTGPTGKDSPDVSFVPVAPECKYMQRLALLTSHLEQAKRNARKLPWVLFLREAKTGRRVVVLDYQHYLKLHHAYYTQENA